MGMPTGSELHEGPPVPALRPLLHGAPCQLHQHAQHVRAAGGLVARVRGQQQAALDSRRQRAVALQQHMHQGAAQGLRAAQTLCITMVSLILPSRMLLYCTAAAAVRPTPCPCKGCKA